MFDELLHHVAPVMSAHQHGFIPKRSCSTNLSTYLKHAWDAMSDGYQIDAIYTDYSATFKSVNHALLIQKLEQSFNLKDLDIMVFKNDLMLILLIK